MTLPLFKSPKISPTFSPSAKIVLHEGDTGKFVRTIPDGSVRLYQGRPEIVLEQPSQLSLAP